MGDTRPDEHGIHGGIIMKRASLSAIAYHVPEKVLGNEELARRFPEWTADQIEQKTGIRSRHIAADVETASDLAFQAAEKLFASGKARPDDIDFLLFCTQAPDYFLPTSACLLQDRLGIKKEAGALDFNLGCSGFIYGLSLAKGLIESGQIETALLLTADTYSKFADPHDKSVLSLFGDAAAATLLRAEESGSEAEMYIGPLVFGTDGSGAEYLSVRNGGLRSYCKMKTNGGAALPADPLLTMDGPAIFSFSLKEVPRAVKRLLLRAGMQEDAIDLFIFHQANAFMLEALRKSLKIPQNKFVVNMHEKGNTVSSTIPIAIADAQSMGILKPPSRLLLVGFGVGLSWGATIVNLLHDV
jgi:3-oxoacyl-[acyl-carrier-protein] synthase-3